MQLEKGWNEEAQICGISYAQQHALWLLHVQDGLTLDELGNIAVWNKSTTSALISRLEKKGYVRKEKEKNSRTIRIYLTEEGRQKIEESINTPECIEYMSLLQSYSEDDIHAILDMLRRLLDDVTKEENPDFKRFIDEFSENLLN